MLIFFGAKFFLGVRSHWRIGEMKKFETFVTVFVILAIVLTSCTKKATTTHPEYKEPLAFEIFKVYEDVPLDTNYAKKVHDTWQNELKDDEVIKNHTWLVGDYKVFIYLHVYMFFVDTSYYEGIFFTTTKPKKCTEMVHSTITVFEADVRDTIIDFSKIKTYVYVNRCHPIKNGTAAKKIMLDYLDEYLHYGSLIGYLKQGLQANGYIRDWGDHYVYEKSPSDFGGAIIINKLTSKLDFLGSSVWMGHGSRYFPIDDAEE
jgi:hypothetical protein